MHAKSPLQGPIPFVVKRRLTNENLSLQKKKSKKIHIFYNTKGKLKHIFGWSNFAPFLKDMKLFFQKTYIFSQNIITERVKENLHVCTGLFLSIAQDLGS